MNVVNLKGSGALSNNQRRNTMQHIIKKTSAGASVILVDTGATLTPEAQAMVLAMYSRSNKSVLDHLEVVAKKGPEGFMATYYVGYGHQSIGELGDVTVCLEGISMLAAKAFQDWMKYRGQEASTRYIDFGSQPFLNPLNDPSKDSYLQSLREFYVTALPIQEAFLSAKHPIMEDADEKTVGVYSKAVKARAFDVLRGFLPAGATTNIAWHVDLREAADQLRELRHHVLEEVRELAAVVEQVLLEKYPSSFGHKKYEQTEVYIGECAGYSLPEVREHTVTIEHDGVDRAFLAKLPKNVFTVPVKTPLSRKVRGAGALRFSMTLDFASYRDIQRQRSVNQNMPLLTTELGFEEWYMNELAPELRERAEKLMSSAPQGGTAVNQYYLPMGFQLFFEASGDLSALHYIVQLRAQKTVHPTLASRTKILGELLLGKFADMGLPFYFDADPTGFSIKRGEQDIIKRV